jgi:hypothetical protein
LHLLPARSVQDAGGELADAGVHCIRGRAPDALEHARDLRDAHGGQEQFQVGTRPGRRAFQLEALHYRGQFGVRVRRPEDLLLDALLLLEVRQVDADEGGDAGIEAVPALLIHQGAEPIQRTGEIIVVGLQGLEIEAEAPIQGVDVVLLVACVVMQVIQHMEHALTECRHRHGV